jgi:hypothetical protein
MAGLIFAGQGRAEMFKVIVSIFVILVATAPAAAQKGRSFGPLDQPNRSGTAPAETQKVTLARDSPLYSEPRLEADHVAQLRQGTTGEVIGKQGGWLNLKTLAGSGWVLTFSVRFQPEEARGLSATGLDRAWQCRPYLSALWPPAFSFRNAACTSAEQDHLSQLLISHYDLDSKDPNSRVRGAQAFQRDSRFRDQQEQRAITEAERGREQEIERARREQEQAEQKRRQAMIDERERKQELQEAAVKERQRQLKAGSTKIENFVDAWLYFSPVQEIGSIMISPLLSPDSGIYGGLVTLDAEEEKDLLRVTSRVTVGIRAIGRSFYQPQVESRYAIIRITNKTANYAPQAAMRLKNEICVIGKYVGNVTYRTTLGTTETAPIIEASHVSASVNAQCYYQPQTVTDYGLRN